MANLKIGSLFFAMKNAAPQTLALCITLSHKQYKENDIILSSLEDILKKTDPSTTKVAQSLVDAIWDQVEAVCLERKDLQVKENST